MNTNRQIIWGRNKNGEWLGTIGDKSYWGARIHLENGKFVAIIGHKTFSEGFMIENSKWYNNIDKAKDKTSKRLIVLDKGDRW